MRLWATLLLSLLLAACATPPALAPPPQLFNDTAFAAPAQPVRTDQVFMLSDAMRDYMNGEIARQARSKSPRRALFDALYAKGQLKLEYDAALTRNAAETFAARSGNCISLVIMTAALAREMGLEVQYQRVQIDENWSRSGQLYVASGHVNIILGRQKASGNTFDASAQMRIDFLPPKEVEGYASHAIDENTIVAMYLNNRAAETLALGQVDTAYWWARAAILQDPGFASAYNTLGVIFLRHGDLAQAQRALAWAHERAPDNAAILSNLAQALDRLGRVAESQALLQQLARIEPVAPFHYFNLGQQALRDGDYAAASRMFAREIERDPYYHEFHFWLAQAYYRMGQLQLADVQLGLALKNSSTREEHNLYAAKLDRLRSHQSR